eukprot:4960353-Amphidinium_carterae.1
MSASVGLDPENYPEDETMYEMVVKDQGSRKTSNMAMQVDLVEALLNAGPVDMFEQSFWDFD